MTLSALLVQLVFVVTLMIGITASIVVGRSRLRSIRSCYRERGRSIAPYLAMLACVLVVNSVTRRVGPEISWVIGWNISGDIYAIEGTLVAQIQSLATPSLTAFFSFIYVYGYVFLLVFPLVAYFALPQTDSLRETTLAYTLNYVVGLVCYILFIAYGPRNLMPELVDSLLYTGWPQSQLLTSEVNSNTNVFPSLHSSLSITVAILAYRTRDVYPRWTPIAIFFASSVVVSTMYLGIHWATDVVAGALLAAGSVYIASRTTQTSVARQWRALTHRGGSLLRATTQKLQRWLNWKQ